MIPETPDTKANTPTPSQAPALDSYFVTATEFGQIIGLARTRMFSLTAGHDYRLIPPPQRVSGSANLRKWTRIVVEQYRDGKLQRLPNGVWVNIETGIPIQVDSSFYIPLDTPAPEVVTPPPFAPAAA